MDSEATAVIWRRWMYALTPQLDIYESLRKVVRRKTILEVGFGTGIGILQYQYLAEYIDAVEIDKSAVQFARRMMPLRSVRWICDDITNPTRRYKGYDMVVMIEVLEHLNKPAKALRIIRNALGIPGYALITVPNKNRYRKREESLNNLEWTPSEIMKFIGEYFDKVWLLDSDFIVQENMDTRESPIIVGASRES